MSVLNKPLRIGVIGVGKLGDIHAKLLRELTTQRKDIDFVGVFDMNLARAKEIAAAYNVKAFESIEAASDELNAAILATTTSTHFEIASALIKRKIHLFIEKPITASVAQAIELIELEKTNDVKIQVGHIERFNPALQSVESYIGEPVFITAERLAGFSKRATDVSVVLDLMIHDIDLILSLVQSEVRHVSASGVSVFSNELDIANARLEFENGTVANVTASRISRSPVRKMRFFCKNPSSYASLDLTTGKSEVFESLINHPKEKTSLKEFATEKFISIFGDIKEALNGRTMEYISPEAPKINALKLEQQSFIDSILQNTPVRVSSHDGKRALEVAVKITDEIVKNQNLMQQR